MGEFFQKHLRTPLREGFGKTIKLEELEKSLTMCKDPKTRYLGTAESVSLLVSSPEFLLKVFQILKNVLESEKLEKKHKKRISYSVHCLGDPFFRISLFAYFPFLEELKHLENFFQQYPSRNCELLSKILDSLRFVKYIQEVYNKKRHELTEDQQSKAIKDFRKAFVKKQVGITQPKTTCFGFWPDGHNCRHIIKKCKEPAIGDTHLCKKHTLENEKKNAKRFDVLGQRLHSHYREKSFFPCLDANKSLTDLEKEKYQKRLQKYEKQINKYFNHELDFVGVVRERAVAFYILEMCIGSSAFLRDSFYRFWSHLQNPALFPLYLNDSNVSKSLARAIVESLESDPDAILNQVRCFVATKNKMSLVELKRQICDPRYESRPCSLYFGPQSEVLQRELKMFSDLSEKDIHKIPECSNLSKFLKLNLCHCTTICEERNVKKTKNLGNNTRQHDSATNLTFRVRKMKNCVYPNSYVTSLFAKSVANEPSRMKARKKENFLQKHSSTFLSAYNRYSSLVGGFTDTESTEYRKVLEINKNKKRKRENNENNSFPIFDQDEVDKAYKIPPKKRKKLNASLSSSGQKYGKTDKKARCKTNPKKKKTSSKKQAKTKKKSRRKKKRN